MSSRRTSGCTIETKRKLLVRFGSCYNVSSFQFNFFEFARIQNRACLGITVVSNSRAWNCMKIDQNKNKGEAAGWSCALGWLILRRLLALRACSPLSSFLCSFSALLLPLALLGACESGVLERTATRKGAITTEGGQMPVSIARNRNRRELRICSHGMNPGSSGRGGLKEAAYRAAAGCACATEPGSLGGIRRDLQARAYRVVVRQLRSRLPPFGIATTTADCPCCRRLHSLRLPPSLPWPERPRGRCLLLLRRPARGRLC